MSRRTSPAFSLVELLIVIAVIALLIGLLLPALRHARQQAKMVREMSAARQLMLGFYAYAHDNRGRVLPGYWPGPAADERGRPVGFPANARYPWRLVPYLDKVFRGAILVNEQEALFGQRDPVNPDAWNYSVSVFPSFGMNIYNVGGHLLGGSEHHVRRLTEPRNPTELIVFASARHNQFGYYEGYHEVRPPVVSTFVEQRPAQEFGFVHPRFNNRAVVGFFDGHAGLLSARELTEPRYWKKSK